MLTPLYVCRVTDFVKIKFLMFKSSLKENVAFENPRNLSVAKSFTHQSKAQINASFDPLYYYGGHKRHWSASSLKLHEVRILSVFQGKHGPQIAEEQLFFRVLANHIQQLFVHLCLILFALIGHSIHLQTECCLSVSMASYIVHKLKVQ